MEPTNSAPQEPRDALSRDAVLAMWQAAYLHSDDSEGQALLFAQQIQAALAATRDASPDSSSGDLTALRGNEPPSAGTPSPSVEHFRRIGWVHSSEEPNYFSFMSEARWHHLERAGLSAPKFDTPVFVALYQQAELDAAAQRAEQIFKGIIVE